MIIKTVSVEYKELRSSGYPAFTNKTYGIAYSADLQAGDSENSVRDLLMAKCVREVKMMHGDDVNQMKLDIPF